MLSCQSHLASVGMRIMKSGYYLPADSRRKILDNQTELCSCGWAVSLNAGSAPSAKTCSYFFGKKQLCLGEGEWSSQLRSTLTYTNFV